VCRTECFERTLVKTTDLACVGGEWRLPSCRDSAQAHVLADMIVPEAAADKSKIPIWRCLLAASAEIPLWRLVVMPAPQTMAGQWKVRMYLAVLPAVREEADEGTADDGQGRRLGSFRGIVAAPKVRKPPPPPATEGRKVMWLITDALQDPASKLRQGLVRAFPEVGARDMQLNGITASSGRPCRLPPAVDGAVPESVEQCRGMLSGMSCPVLCPTGREPAAGLPYCADGEWTEADFYTILYMYVMI